MKVPRANCMIFTSAAFNTSTPKEPSLKPSKLSV